MRRLLTLFLLLALAAWAVHGSGISEHAPKPTGDREQPAEITHATPSSPADPAVSDIRVIRIIDGDSLLLDMDGSPVEVRLMGVDAPEFQQDWGRQATEYVRAWTGGKQLALTFGSRRMDRYDRLLAYVWNGDKLLNADLVRAGLALPYMLDQDEPHCAAIHSALQEAKQDKAGFWSQGGLEMTPRQWRKEHQ